MSDPDRYAAPRRSGRRRVTMSVSALAVVALFAAGCAGSSAPTGSGGRQKTADEPSAAPTSAAVVTSNIRTGAPSVKLGRKVRLTVASGTFTQVAVSGPQGALAGRLSADKASWTSTGTLLPDQRYDVSSTAVDADGVVKSFASSFHTAKLTKDQQTYPSFFPTGGTYGVAMPVVIRFDVPVTDRASIEKHFRVVSSPAQAGAFHWISSTEVHWRPKTYWRAGTTVTVKANIAGVPAGNGIYGQLNRQTTFHIGRAQVDKVDIRTDQLKVYRGGKLVRTIPVTTGAQPDFTTRSGIKVIVEKDRRHDMNSETIGIDPNGPNGYNLKGVEYAMRLTYSGEFLHAAPWSVASQGHANVSHGCTGMSTANAAWLYASSLIGDPVEYTGSSRQMTLTNGFGDWNEPFATYATGSALS